MVHVRDVAPYLTAYVAAEYIGLGYCLLYAPGVVAWPRWHFRKALAEAWASIRVGSKLLVATSASALILGVSRIVIDARWSISVFAQVSLGVTIVGFVVTLMAQVSLVLYPALRMATEGTRSAALLHIRTITVVLLSGLVTWSIFRPPGPYSPGFQAAHSALGLAVYLMPMCVTSME